MLSRCRYSPRDSGRKGMMEQWPLKSPPTLENGLATCKLEQASPVPGPQADWFIMHRDVSKEDTYA